MASSHVLVNVSSLGGRHNEGYFNKDRIFSKKKEPPSPERERLPAPPTEAGTAGTWRKRATRYYYTLTTSALPRGNSLSARSHGTDGPGSTPTSRLPVVSPQQLLLEVSLAPQLFSASSVLGSPHLSFLPNLPHPSYPGWANPAFKDLRLAHQELKTQI